MKAQLSLEFLTITLISVVYLTSVLALYSSVKQNLEIATDKKTMERIEVWGKFIVARPEGTEVINQIKIYPRRWLEVQCGDETELRTPSSERTITIPSICSSGSLNLSESGFLSIMKSKGGIIFEER